MNPPAEQLVRDYLNRVSVAARGRLSADDRRAFLARTRDFIEQNTRALGRTDHADVLKLLSGLGDATALVDREHDRLAGQRADPGASDPAPGKPAAGDPAARQPGTRDPASGSPAGRVTGADPAARDLVGDSLPARDAVGRNADTGDPAGGSRPGRARRRRPRRGTLADLLTAPATAVPPGQVVPVPEPADDAPLTGELRFQTRPITSRWRPGAAMASKPPRSRRAGIPRRLQPDDRQPGNGQDSPAAAARPGEAGPGQPPAGSVPPPAADSRRRPRRPAWPSLAVSPPEADAPGRADGMARAGELAHGDRPPPASGTSAPGGPARANGGPPSAAPPPAGPPPGDADAGGFKVTSADASGFRVAGTDTSGTGASSTGHGGPANSGTGGASASPQAPSNGVSAGGVAGPRAPADKAPFSYVPLDAQPGAAPGPVQYGPVPSGPGSVGGAPDSDGSADGMGGSRRAGWARAWSAWTGGLRDSGRVTRQIGSPGEESADGPGPGSLGLPAGSLAAIGGATGKLARTVLGRARRRPLEATAIVLLGLGGLIFPPVWLMGAAVALASKVWDFRDKWIGLAVPVFLVIVGMAADVSLGGTRHGISGYAWEAWIFGGHISRIVAALGAVYLGWRAERGRRSPAVPPWNKPHRFG